MNDLGADRAFLLVGFQRRLAGRAGVLFDVLQRLAVHVRFQQAREVLGQADRQQVLAQREAPCGETLRVVHQLQVAHAGVVVQF